MKTHTLVIGAAVVVAIGLAFIANNFWYIHQHPLAAVGQAASDASAAPAAAHGTPPMPQDAQHAAAYEDLEARLKAIRREQK